MGIALPKGVDGPPARRGQDAARQGRRQPDGSLRIVGSVLITENAGKGPKLVRGLCNADADNVSAIDSRAGVKPTIVTNGIAFFDPALICPGWIDPKVGEKQRR